MLEVKGKINKYVKRYLCTNIYVMCIREDVQFCEFCILKKKVN